MLATTRRSRGGSLATLLLITATTTASAEPRHVLVLRAEGNADAATRGKVDTEVSKLAKTMDGNVELGEISFSDAAAAVGCSGSEAQCRDEVLGMMGVDEIISTSVTALPSGDLRVVVHRIPKGQPTKDVQSTVPTGQPLDAKLATDVGPMFGVKVKPTSTSTPTPTPTPTPTRPNANVNANANVHVNAGAPTGAWGNQPANQTAPIETAQVDPSPQPSPFPGGPAEERKHSRPVTGLAIGGGLVVLSVILWAEAGSVQGEINSAPTKTPADFANLKDLESKGDTYSNLGNLCFLGGLVVGGISGYFFYKDYKARHSTAQARITPTLFDHGAGIAFSYGGLP
ncbi:hypothetical protein BH11MYX1_BH11MYX1_17800 [soil metagenome]